MWDDVVEVLRGVDAMARLKWSSVIAGALVGASLLVPRGDADTFRKHVEALTDAASMPEAATPFFVAGSIVLTLVVMWLHLRSIGDRLAGASAGVGATLLGLYWLHVYAEPVVGALVQRDGASWLAYRFASTWADWFLLLCLYAVMARMLNPPRGRRLAHAGREDRHGR